LPSEQAEGTVNIFEIIEHLKQFEKTEMYVLVGEEEQQVADIDEYLQFIEEVYGLTRTHSDNSYNHSGNVSHDFYWHTYSYGSGNTLVKFAVHRYGDPRGNYTCEALLEFDYVTQFVEAIFECDTSVTIGDYYVNISALSESMEVFESASGEHVKTIYSLDDFEEEMKEEA
jgi:hypothetical protein